MPDYDPTQEVPEAVLEKIITRVFDELVESSIWGQVQTAIGNGQQVSSANLIGGLLNFAGRAGAFLATELVTGEDVAKPAYSRLLAAAVKDVTGADISSQLSPRPGDRGQRTDAGRVVGKALLDGLTSSSGGVTPGNMAPSAAGAEQYMGFVTQMALEGWLQGVIGELVSLGFIKNLGDLDDTLANILGLGRMTRSVVRPLLNARVITPFQWHVNKTYRPELLSAGEVSRQVARGRWSRERGIEELARQGWSDDRIEALFNAAAKFHSIADLDLLVRTGQLSRDGAVQHLRDQGYDESIANTELQLEQTRRDATFERALATAAVTAYVDRRIEREWLIAFITGNTISVRERAQILELADARRTLNRKAISVAEVRAAVKAGILAVRDYRQALRADGYDEGSALTLELLLRHEIEEKEEIEELRRRAAADRAAEKAERERERLARKAEIAAARALARRGDEADLERAVVKGQIPIARYVEVIRPRYDADTVAIMIELVEDARAELVAREAAAEAARLRALSRNIDIGALQAAVLEGVLTVDEFARHPSLATIAPADRSILVALVRERLDDRNDANKAREAAAAAARKRQLNLGRYETLVRRGIHSIPQYDALLRQLELPEAARVNNLEWLRLQIADDEAARRKREEIDEQLRHKGLSLEQFRRAVILGQQTAADYTAFVLAHGYTADVATLLTREVQIDIQEAEAARRRREQAERVVEASRLPLATVHRAARLGVLSPANYFARLRLEGYSEDDIAVETELLLFEIADVQIARASGTAIDPAIVGDKQLLDDEMNRRRAELLARDEPRALSLGQLEDLVLKDLQSVEDFYTGAVALGYSPEDAELLAMLVVKELEKRPPAAS